MALEVRRTPSRKTKLISTLIAVFALVLQPAYGFVTSQVANAATTYTQLPFTPSELSTNWIADRTTPSGGFESKTFGGRNNVLEERIDTTHASPSSGFYRTEGLQRQIPASDTVKADLYIDSDWYNKDVRAGLWAVGKDADGAVASYPIVEFIANNGANYTGWRVYNSDNGTWTNTSSAYNPDAWNTLELTHDTANDTFKVLINGTQITTTPAISAVNIGAVILNSFNAANNDASYNYAVRWSDLTIGSQTPPATPTGLKFINPTVACGGATNVMGTTATWTAVSDAASYNYRSWAPNASSYNTEATAYTTSSPANSLAGSFSLGQGPYFFEVQAVNTQGLKSDWSAPCGVTYDITKPGTPTLVSPADNSTVNGASLVNKWNSVGDAVKYVYQSYNNAAATSIRYTETTTDTQKIASNVANGTTFWWRVKAVDAAGNEGSWSNLWKVTIDNVQPTGVVTYSPDTLTNGNVLATLVTSEPVQDLAGWSRKSDTKFQKAYPKNDNTPNWDQNVTITDLAGNTNTVHVYIDWIDTTAPVLSTTVVDGVVSGTKALDLSATEDHPDVYNIRVLNSDGSVAHFKDGTAVPGLYVTGSSSNSVSYSWDTAQMNDGQYRIQFSARDGANNPATTLFRTLTVDNTAPVVTINTPAAIKSGDTLTLTGDADDATSVTVTIDGVSYSGAIISGTSWSLVVDTSSLTVDSHTVTVSGIDAVGNTSALKSTTLTINSPNTAGADLSLITPGQGLIVSNPVTTQNATTTQSVTSPNSVDAAVLGAETTNKDSSVLGDQSKNVAAITPSAEGWKFFGVLWYWWLLLIAAVAAIWWFVAARRRRAEQNI